MRIQGLFHTVLAVCLARTSFAVQTTDLTFEVEDFHPNDIISRDVAIIGGGSAGTYSAISLKDKGKSSIIIEKKSRIGGHCETYIDPATGTPIDIGVITFSNTSVVRNYFGRFKIPLTKIGSFGGATNNYDFRTGMEVNVSSPEATQVGAAFAGYAEQVAKYPDLGNGMFLPNPVPEDLYMPFGDFIVKYSIQDVLQTLYIYNPGLGDILTVPTVEMMRMFNPTVLGSLANGFLTTQHHNNSELYTEAQIELLSDSSLLLNSEVLHVQRSDSDHGVKLVVNTPKGRKLVCAKKLIMAIPPHIDFLTPLDLTKQEKEIFSKLVGAGYYASILKNTGLPDSVSFVANHVQNTPYNLPPLPGTYNIVGTGVPGLHTVYCGTPLGSKSAPLSDDDVKADIIASIQKIQKENPGKFNRTTPEFVVYSSHAPFYLQARPEDTKNGFYKKMYALQGVKNTFWTGGTWKAQDSSEIWRFTEETVLPQLLKGL
ncbi:amine oxidase, flavin-containing superfamily [Clohesyomyces aquaticus]|uniref:Amine oxidase, flavin-containing superfamily n=1 Tax=Clohesyomyces aquaticus TaxID=1231657 RepID=A0A1Y2A528_9PLEO|nr:amine oxidase, flavin-containing superfamily [Clohesyomyces aquaticus]